MNHNYVWTVVFFHANFNYTAHSHTAYYIICHFFHFALFNDDIKIYWDRNPKLFVFSWQNGCLLNAVFLFKDPIQETKPQQQLAQIIWAFAVHIGIKSELDHYKSYYISSLFEAFFITRFFRINDECTPLCYTLWRMWFLVFNIFDTLFKVNNSELMFFVFFFLLISFVYFLARLQIAWLPGLANTHFEEAGVYYICKRS